MVALVHLGAGIGNIVLATPLLLALDELGYAIDLRLSADYAATAELFDGWSVVRRIIADPEPCPTYSCYDVIIPAIPPFYWPRFRSTYRPHPNLVARPPDALFYENEQAYYLAFARTLGFSADRHPDCYLPIAPGQFEGVTGSTIVLAPGCKTGEMAAKRWPWFTELASRFDNVALVGTADDLRRANGQSTMFPLHVRNFAGVLTLRQTAELMAAAGLVIANDSGLGHVASALGVPTVMLFGPTPDRTLGPLPANVVALRSGLPCEPCWFSKRFQSCGNRIDCLRSIAPDRVANVALALMQPFERVL